MLVVRWQNPRANAEINIDLAPSRVPCAADGGTNAQLMPP
jgi:hypothetical protein